MPRVSGRGRSRRRPARPARARAKSAPEASHDHHSARYGGRHAVTLKGRAPRARDVVVAISGRPDRFFRREGLDVIAWSPSTGTGHARLEDQGAHLDGKRVVLKVPPAPRTAEVPDPGQGSERNGRRGDQYVEIHVQIPEKLTLSRSGRYGICREEWDEALASFHYIPTPTCSMCGVHPGLNAVRRWRCAETDNAGRSRGRPPDSDAEITGDGEVQAGGTRVR